MDTITIGSVTIGSNLLLAFLTAIYVILTLIILTSQNKATKKNFSFMQKQLDMRSMPILYCTVNSKPEPLLFTVSNYGNMLAYNVEVYIYCYISHGKLTDYSFDDSIQWDENNDEDFPVKYSMIDLIGYPLFVHNKKVCFKPAFPFTNPNYKVILEYSDIYGNYHSSYFEFVSEYSDDYSMVATIPGFLEKHEYLDFRDIIMNNNKRKLPKHLINSAPIIDTNSKPELYFDLSFQKKEDRGTWSNI